MSGSGVRFEVLGPLAAAGRRGPVDLKGPRHRAVLARLLIAKGRVVPVSWLIDDLWDDPPEGALGAVQTFVGALRKALEPDRPPRTPSTLLVTVAPGYALRAEPGAVDAWRFEATVTKTGRLLAAGQAREAHTGLADALAGWRGPAYADFAEEPWARAEAGRLEELRWLAVLRRAEASLALGLAAEAVPDLEAAVTAHPLREENWRLLAVALYRSGRQGDALGMLRRARAVLRDELGLDPGPGLQELEADVLAQAPSLTAPNLTAPLPATSAPGTPAPATPAPATPAPATPAPDGGGPPPDGKDQFVGRTRELANLAAAARDTAWAGRPRLALVSGTAGAGKTALAMTLAARLAADGWTTAWGASSEQVGAPTAWPWTQLRSSLTAAGHPPPPPEPDAPDDDPAVARFQRNRAIGAYLATISRRSPVLLVLDDLHWADPDTLALLTALVTDSDLGPVLIVGTYRSTEISPGLTEALGRAARVEPTRVYLGGLTEPQVLRMMTAITHRPVTVEQARVVHARSAGNPFFVRELSRLWEAEGDAGLRAVPAGVRDVIRHRLAGLTEPGRLHLRQAALIGEDIDLDLLITLAGAENAVLTSVESALLAGFLVDREADGVELEAGGVRFAHTLVRETLYADIPRVRRSRWHTAVAEILERTRPDDVATIAHHFLRAESRTTAGRAARYARTAAERAEPHQAARLWRETLDALDRATDGVGGDPGTRLVAVMGLVRALAVTGDLPGARRLRADALDTAATLGDPLLTAGVIGAFDVPAIWTTNDDQALSRRVVAVAEETLVALPAGHRAERARLLGTIAMERRADPGHRGRNAAREAEAVARDLDDPHLLAFALNGRFMHSFDHAGLAPQRVRLGHELLDLATRHGGMLTYQVLGRLILIQASAALADLGAADRHAAAADELADRFGLPLVGVFTDFYAALRLAVTGRADEARNAYRGVAARLPGTGMFGVQEGIFPLARFCLAAAGTGLPGAGGTDSGGGADFGGGSDFGGGFGPYELWIRPLILFARDDRARALAAARLIPDSPRDLLFEARTCLHAMVALRTGELSTMERLYAELLPAAGELAGAGSGLVTLGPVAHQLGDLSRALGRSRQAAEHYRLAMEIAARAGAPHWTATARNALATAGPAA